MITNYLKKYFKEEENNKMVRTLTHALDKSYARQADLKEQLTDILTGGDN